MKTALCISGKWDYRSNIKWIELLKERLPHDEVYTACWEGDDFDADFKFPEPEFIYHPILNTEGYDEKESIMRRKIFAEDYDLSENKTFDLGAAKLHKKKSKYWNLQILIHNELMKRVDADMIIRARFDTIVSDRMQWKNFLYESYDCLTPIGFNTINFKKKWPHHEFAPMHEGAQFYINDALIFHPKRLWDTELVDSLHSERNLMGAEEGWYQVLSEPWGNIHKSWHGGAYMAGVWEHIKDVDESLHN